MTLADWVHRDPAPPPTLAARMERMTSSLTAATPREASDVLLGAAADLLSGILPHGCGDRANAVDLLVADALVTYAFEAAADAPEMLEAQATRAMSRLGALAEGPVHR